MESLKIFDIIGIAAFSIAGTFAAMEKKLDVFGIFIIAFVTALGGGTLRDMLLGRVPVGWLFDLSSGLVVLLSAIMGLFFKTVIKNYHKVLLFFDAIGLGFFTIVGIHTGISLEMHALACIALGTITACFGGVIRDVALSNIPLIFQKEIYATASILGGVVFFLLLRFGLSILQVEIICLIIVVMFRLLSVKFHWQLPVIWKQKGR